MKSELKTRPLKALSDAYVAKELRVNPEYQRGLQWSLGQRQGLIDSLLRGYQIPIFYVHLESRTNNYTQAAETTAWIVDGQQRLAAIVSYCQNEFALPDPKKARIGTVLPVEDAGHPNWTGKKFEELNPDDKKRLLDHDLLVVEITAQKNEVRDLFIRLQAGTPLTAQEKRDAWPGDFTNFVIKHAGKPGHALSNPKPFFSQFKKKNAKRLSVADGEHYVDMYLDAGLRDHGLLQAIARVNRPYNDLKKIGVVLDYYGVFEKLDEALNYDKNELGEVAFPFTRLREQFKVEMQLQMELFSEFPKSGDRDNIMKILAWLNVNEPKREKFELGYRNLSLLWESLHPDPFLIDFEPSYLWLGRVWIYYVKEFYPLAQKFETDPTDGAKTRALIRQNVDVEDLKKNLPTYVLDANYLTNISERPPDSKALNIEALLAAELQIRIGEDEEFQPLSERLKRIVQQKRNGTLAGLALLKELEGLAKETVALIQESQRPVADSFIKIARERSPGLSPEEAAKIVVALIAKADEILFPGWIEQEDSVGRDLFREFTKILARQFASAGLHGTDKDFVERCIKLLRLKNYRAKAHD